MSSIREIALAKAIGGGSGPSVTVEPLSVDENGVYTAPAGKAYSPVTVEVSGGGGGVYYARSSYAYEDLNWQSSAEAE